MTTPPASSVAQLGPGTVPSERPARKPIRLWPGVAVVSLQWLLWFVVPFLFPKLAIFAIFGGLACAVVIVIWWLFFSRALWVDRIGALVFMIIAVMLTKRIVHPSIAGGMMGMMLPIFSLPVLCLALVGAVTLGRRLNAGTRRLVIAVAIVLACGVFMLIRTSGITGEARSDLHWRWTKTPEDRLLALSKNEITAASATTVTAPTASEWPGFRGANRDGIVHGVRIDTDWTRHAPVALWREPVGPGWSSFAVSGNRFYTQEQRGDDEIVSCYSLNDGKPVWRHRDATRFYESNGGAGPRATPTLNNGRVYTFGATGILNALNAADGSVVWSRNVATDTNTKEPGWGFSSSPLVVNDEVLVAAAGTLAAYDLATGNLRWTGPHGTGYSSPQLATIGGTPQVLLVNNQGVLSVAPADGSVLWKHPWSGDSIVQPAVTADGDVLLGSGSGMGSDVGLRRVAITHGADGWTAKALWTSTEINPYFNDFVINKDYVFGFDGDSIGCLDLKTGALKWKGGSYGYGQIVLIADQDLLLVTSEKGELALVKATPDQFSEVARFKAIQGKTWNHPVLVHDVLLMRNGEEMAAFRMTPAN